jgi:hypothetical protein
MLGASWAFARGAVKNSNPIPPTSGSASQNTTATAQPFPDFEDELVQLRMGLRYHFWKSWYATLGYTFEYFRSTDWRTDGLNPFVPGVTSIWLGNDLRGYTAHIISGTLGYRF